MSRINHQANEIMVPRGIEIIFISLIFYCYLVPMPIGQVLYSQTLPQGTLDKHQSSFHLNLLRLCTMQFNMIMRTTFKKSKGHIVKPACGT